MALVEELCKCTLLLGSFTHSLLVPLLIGLSQWTLFNLLILLVVILQRDEEKKNDGAILNQSIKLTLFGNSLIIRSAMDIM